MATSVHTETDTDTAVREIKEKNKDDGDDIGGDGR